MPNYVKNRIRCHEDNWDGLCTLVLDESKNVDFNRLIPCPDDVYRGSIQFGEMPPEGYSETWYTWNRREWGTKWNASWTKIHEDRCEIEFTTAWSFPAPVMEALGKKAAFEITGMYADEDLGHNLGVFLLSDSGIYYGYRQLQELDDAQLANLSCLIHHGCSYKDACGSDYGNEDDNLPPCSALEETYDVWGRCGLSFSNDQE